MARTTSKIAIIGLGTVGSGVAEILMEQQARLARHAGCRLELAKAVVRDLGRARAYSVPRDLLTDRVEDVIADPEIEVVAQLIGGLEPARSIMLRLLQSGKNIVTANKALLAEHGPELFDRARQLGRSIAFDAAVAGGVPIITNISQCLSANQILSLRGILNGTSNFIVSQMEEHGTDYAQAVALAQERGYAEADPTMDVDGTDAAQKLAILSHLAFGAKLKWADVPRTGIDRLDPIDLKWAQALGYRIKLLAVAQLLPESSTLEAHVAPTLVRIGTPLAEVRGAYNAISVVGDMVGRVFFQGLGAGRLPTASAVVADLVDTVVGRSELTFRTLELWSPTAARTAIADHLTTEGRFYLRLTVEDHPGVLADIAGVLGRHGISIASLIQRELESDLDDAEAAREDVMLVMMTHAAQEGRAAAAMDEINQLDSVRSGTVRMRVLD